MKLECKRKKRISFLIIFILLFHGIVMLVSAYDELDQYQTSFDIGILLGSAEGLNVSIAQSFRPQKEILTRVELFIERDLDHPAVYPYLCAVRHSLSGENLVVASVDPDVIPVGTYEWVVFDFDDIPVSIGGIYYIVSYTAYEELESLYVWGCSESNLYPNGRIYGSDDGWATWGSLDNDMCFKTYGTYAPLVADAGGPSEGVVGINVQFLGGAAHGKPPYSWYWDFGDGNFSTSQNPVHSYGIVGEYQVTLTVMDDDENVDVDVKTVVISKPASLRIESISGGRGVTVVMKNIGEFNVSDVEMDISIVGGVFMYLPTMKYEFSLVNPGESEKIVVPVLGFGFGVFTGIPTIVITVRASEVASVTESVYAKIMFSRVII
ncbi:MAG: PKD domain-containing protein [Methanobacteriota archaeon]